MRLRGDLPASPAVIERGAPGYPAALLDLQHPPGRLYVLGDAAHLDAAPERTAAIVGTREASPYGLRVAAELARTFAASGIAVVSGLARGIDTAAHRGALASGGSTVAVLGTGVDVPYPAANRDLHASLVASGAVVSEFEPGAKASLGCFPRRNRIIAALAKVTFVVEAPFKSGAINTAAQALDLGRVVAAVPGPIDSPRSAGSNLLLRDGAQVITSMDDALALFGVAAQGRGGAGPGDLGVLEAALWEALSLGDAVPEILAVRSGLSVREALEGVARLELSGLVRQTHDGQIARATFA